MSPGCDPRGCGVPNRAVPLTTVTSGGLFGPLPRIRSVVPSPLKSPNVIRAAPNGAAGLIRLGETMNGLAGADPPVMPPVTGSPWRVPVAETVYEFGPVWVDVARTLNPKSDSMPVNASARGAPAPGKSNRPAPGPPGVNVTEVIVGSVRIGLRVSPGATCGSLPLTTIMTL